MIRKVSKQYLKCSGFTSERENDLKVVNKMYLLYLFTKLFFPFMNQYLFFIVSAIF